MASSDRAFRALAQAEPDTVARLLRVVAPGLLPPNVSLEAADVDDSHAHGLPPALDADLVARVGEEDVLHVELQGYRDRGFVDRVVYYHLTNVLRFKPRKVSTLALWFKRPPADQCRDVIEVGDVTVRIRNIVLGEIDAELLLGDPRTCCFAAAADAANVGEEALCDAIAQAMMKDRASWYCWQMAVVAAASCGRYEYFMQAMRRADMEPMVIEDLVKFGEDRGFENGVARGFENGLASGALSTAKESLVEVLLARGLTVQPDDLRIIEGEQDPTRLRTWLRRAATADSVEAVFADEG